jgi:hypothetical protein
MVGRLLIFVVCSDQLYSDTSASTFIQLDVLPAAFIGLPEFRLADISLQLVEGQHRVLAGIQAPQAKVPELVGSISLIKILPVPVLRARYIQNRGIGGRLALAVNDCTLNGCPVCAHYYVQRRSGADDESRIGDVSASKVHRFRDVVAEIVRLGPDQQLVTAACHILQLEATVLVYTGNCRVSDVALRL